MRVQRVFESLFPISELKERFPMTAEGGRESMDSTFNTIQELLKLSDRK
jgi:hypothetical protein